MRKLLLLSTAVALSATSAANGQSTAAKPDSTCTKYSDGRVECRSYRRIAMEPAFGDGVFRRLDSVMAKRAALGIELRTTGTRRDTLGVFVEGVTPKGPAENAGIIEGDRIAAINGVDLRTPANDIEDSYSNGLASHRLTREVQKLTPGSRVTLRVFSNGRFRDVQVVAGKATDLMRVGARFNIDGPIGRRMMMPFDGPRGGMILPPPGPPPELYDMDDIDDVPDADIPPLTPDEIRELVAAVVRGVAPALKQLVAGGVA